jgi:hypothetical protein
MSDPTWPWRRRLLLANGVVFWNSFIVFGVVPMGIAATAVHFILVVAHTAAFAAPRELVE